MKLIPSILIITTFSTVLIVNTVYSQEKPKVQAQPNRIIQVPGEKKNVKELTVMERKLKNAQLVLEGLAIKDFKKIEKGADELMQCVKDATWRINDTDKYLMHSNDFIRNIEALQKASKSKSIDSATLAYVDMTLTCVKCHEHLRETRIGQAPDLAERLKIVTE